MKIQTPLRFTLLALALAVPARAAQEYVFDSTESKITFTTKSFGLMTTNGSFKKFSGRILYDPEDVTKSKAAVTIETASIDTGNTKRDDHLRTTDFFDSARYPTLTFQSEKIEKVDETYTMTGPLMMHGVARPVTITFSFIPAAGLLNAQGTASVNRRDFELNHGSNFSISNAVGIALNIHAQTKPLAARAR